MGDDMDQSAKDKPLEVDDESLQDLELTEDSEAEDVQGGMDTVMCATIGNCHKATRV